MERIWLKHYPRECRRTSTVSQYRSLTELLEESFRKYAQRDAFIFMDHALSYAELERLSTAFGAWLQGAGLSPGARVAIMLPNVLQYPVALARDPARGLRGGERQPAVHAARARAPAQGLGCRGDRDPGELRRDAAAGDRPDRGQARARHLARPSCSASEERGGEPGGAPRQAPGAGYSLPGTCAFHDVLEGGSHRKLERVPRGPEDLAFLQYTGGNDRRGQGRDAAGNRNLIANLLAVRSVVRAGAARHQPRRRVPGAVRVRLRPAAVSLLRAARELPARPAPRRRERAASRTRADITSW